MISFVNYLVCGHILALTALTVMLAMPTPWTPIGVLAFVVTYTAAYFGSMALSQDNVKLGGALYILCALGTVCAWIAALGPLLF